MTDAETARLATLTPETRAAFFPLERSCADAGIVLFVGSCRRTRAQQAEAHASGHSSQPVSWHELGRGMDLYPVVDGSPDLAGHHVDLFRKMHELAPACGLHGIAFNPDGTPRYINTPKGRVWDGGHLEYRAPYVTLAEAVNAEGIDGPAVA